MRARLRQPVSVSETSAGDNEPGLKADGRVSAGPAGDQTQLLAQGLSVDHPTQEAVGFG
jgi:hypothetical protein